MHSWRYLEHWFLGQVELQRCFSRRSGCTFGTVGHEGTERDSLLRQNPSLSLEAVQNKIATFCVKEKDTGQLTRETNEEQMADFCIATIQGAMHIGKIKRNSQPVETTIREALVHLKRYVVTPKG